MLTEVLKRRDLTASIGGRNIPYRIDSPFTNFLNKLDFSVKGVRNDVIRISGNIPDYLWASYALFETLDRENAVLQEVDRRELWKIEKDVLYATSSFVRGEYSLRRIDYYNKFFKEHRDLPEQQVRELKAAIEFLENPSYSRRYPVSEIMENRLLLLERVLRELNSSKNLSEEERKLLRKAAFSFYRDTESDLVAHFYANKTRKQHSPAG